MDKSTIRLKLQHFGVDRLESSDVISVAVVPMDLQNDEATKRLVMHSARRVIKHHKDEIQELAFK